MKPQRKAGPRTRALGVVAVCGALTLTACGANGGSAPSPSPSAPSPSPSAAAGAIACGKTATLRASGSTAQQYAMKYWITTYTRACAGTKIAYDGNGSGAGQDDFLRGRTAFAGSDSPLDADQVKQSEKVCADGGRAIHLPIVGGPIAVAFHLPGVDRLVLDAPTLAKIFNGRITQWDDPAIAGLNKDAKLPATPIRTFHRSDSSGTTDNFTAYLAATARDTWPYPHAKKWPAQGGGSAKGSADLAAQVQRTTGGIGYVELPYAVDRMLRTVSVATGAATPADANVIAASHAIAGARTVNTGHDVILDLDYGTKVPGAYPIDVVTYEIVCDKGNKPETWPATKAFLAYMASQKGQQNLTFQGYATLPAKVVDAVRHEIGTLS
ncbi:MULTISPECIES: phosphate ABC transporter substrate-binding protein PstS [Streptomyces]|uniref:Phosphate-binding protein n=2 Tax=Streptomyces TaxID=1883 RepID=A0A2N8PKC2_STRNR|nr:MULTISPECIES: phosphate ABC transporter substrate-binding protein PstS [Streptomyces]PNE41441.1 phosphate-binding protein [Streptomyces noursei]SHM11110.1 phosphate ABC transporter substrate-binding protein, PhoT family [Streptomyces yunnanensis]